MIYRDKSRLGNVCGGGVLRVRRIMGFGALDSARGRGVGVVLRI